MERQRILQFLAVGVIWAAGSTSSAQPSANMDGGVCHQACYQGAGEICPEEGDLRAACAEAGCPGGSPGCVEGLNCPGGYRMQCNFNGNA